MLSRTRAPFVRAAMLALLLATAGCSSGGDDAPPSESANATAKATAPADSSTCGYLYEWVTDLPLPPPA